MMCLQDHYVLLYGSLCCDLKKHVSMPLYLIGNYITAGKLQININNSVVINKKVKILCTCTVGVLELLETKNFLTSLMS